MKQFQSFLNTTTGRYVLRGAILAFTALVQGGVIPGDFAIPLLGVSIAQTLPWLAQLIPTGEMNRVPAPVDHS